MAGTSEHGVCPECHAPYERIIKKQRIKISDSKRFSGCSMRNDSEDGRYTSITKTTGWQPTCNHPATDNVIPATVLDIFAGSGTTGLVSRQLGRNSILFDVSYTYITEHIMNRLSINQIHAWNNQKPSAIESNVDDLPLFSDTQG
jgi:hypothetical protein